MKDDIYTRNDEYTRDTTASYGDKSPEEIEQEIERTRAKMSDTLSALENKLSPGQLMDQALGYFRNASSGPSEFTANLGRTVRNNPIPVALVGIGLGWLILGGSEGFSRRRGYATDTYGDYPDASPYDVYSTDYDVYGAETEQTAESKGKLKDSMEKLKDTASSAWEQASEKAQAAGEQVGQAAHQVRERVGQAAHQARERVGQTAHQVRERMGQATQRMGETTHQTRERMEQATHHARERAGQVAHDAQERMGSASDAMRHRAGQVSALARDKSEQAKQGFNRVLHEQPLVVSAVAFAVGAVLGAALPPTRREDELMGRKRDALVESAEEMGKEQLDKARHMAEAVQEAVKEEAKQQGLTPEGIKEQLRQVPEKAGRVAEAAKEAAKEEAERQDLGAPLSGKTEPSKTGDQEDTERQVVSTSVHSKP